MTEKEKPAFLALAFLLLHQSGGKAAPV